MQLLYCHDNYYISQDDGSVYSAGQFPYEYWAPFLENCDELVVTGRKVENPEDFKQHNLSSGPHVSFELFPNINSPSGLLKHLKSVDKEVGKLVEKADAVIVRAVSDIGWLAFKHARALDKPVAMEMAACAWDSTWHHGNKLGKIYAPIRYMRARMITSKADHVLYVTRRFLQDRYPCKGTSAAISNVRLERIDDDMLKIRTDRILEHTEHGIPWVIGMIGNLDNKIKGVSDAIKALSIVNARQPGSFVFHHLGPGDPEPYTKQIKALGLEDVVRFDGMRESGEAVFEWLRHVDIYLQPSYQEGLPRATIEAMSLACPVIASTAGGIPELIAHHYLMKPGDTGHLADLIEEMITDPQGQITEGCLNLNKSKGYLSERLVPARSEFWKSFADFVKERSRSGPDKPQKKPAIQL
jgi:glycosyltransferase involved in cell wall biosynthesis